MKTVSLALLLLVPFLGRSNPEAPSSPKRTVGPLKLSELTTDKAVRFQLQAPFTVVVPPGIGFVITDAIGPGAQIEVGIRINGFGAGGFGYTLRQFHPPIVARGGDTVELTAGIPTTVIIGGFACPQADVSGVPPTNSVPIAPMDFTLDRTFHYSNPAGPATTWSITVPPAGLTLVVVNWSRNGNSSPITWTVDGAPVAATIADYEVDFQSPIIVRPGQTLTLSSQQQGSVSGDMGGYLAYPGET